MTLPPRGSSLLLACCLALLLAVYGGAALAAQPEYQRDEPPALRVTFEGPSVEPPFWQTLWFRVLAGLLVVGGIAIGLGVRMRRMEARIRALQIRVAERTHEIEEHRQELAALFKADDELYGHRELDPVLEALVKITVDVLNADKSAVLTWDRDREHLAIRVARGFGRESIEHMSFVCGKGLAARVAETGKPAVVENAPEDPLLADEPEDALRALSAEGIRSLLHLPIITHDQVFGVFCVAYYRAHAFGEDQQRLFAALADRAARAIENADHFSAEHRRAEQFEVLAQVGHQTTVLADVDTVLARVARLIRETFGYYHVGIGLIEGDEVVYRVGAGALWDDPAFGFQPQRLKIGSEGLTGWVAGTGQPVVVDDVRKDPRYVWMQGSATLSEATAPILIAGRVVGVLDAQSEHLNAFDDSDLRVLQLLANQAAIAIANARLYEAEQHRVAQLTALQETTRVVASTLEQDALLRQIIQQATSLLRGDGGLINLVDWDKREDEVVAATGATSDLVGYRGSLDDSLSGWITLHNQPVISSQLRTDSRVAPDALPWLVERNIESVAAAPLAVKDQVVGTLFVLAAGGARGEFEQSDLDLLVAFANQAAVAIENARLYKQAQRLAVVEERGRIARDLHDAVTQTLFSASLISEALPAIWASDRVEGEQLLQELRQLSRGALAEMRTLLLELRPTALMEADLGDLLRQLAEAAAGRAGVRVNVRVDGKHKLPDEVHVALYRIAQEALNNVVKHARATEVDLVLRHPVQAGAELSVQDNGRGFDPEDVPLDHLGLGIIQERAQAIGAELDVQSAPGKGTRVRVEWKSGEGR